MFKTTPVALATLLAFAAPALAQRASSTAMTCAEASAYVRARGGVVLGTGGMTYDRFVSDARFCERMQSTKVAFVPSRDNPQCPVGYTCIDPFNLPSDTNR